MVVLVVWAASAALSAPTEESEEPAFTAPANPVETRERQETETAPTSTPRDQWRKGEMPYLYQIDPQWADTAYSGGTLAEQGCGPTALDMVYIYLTGNTDLDPAGMAAFATENGYSTEGQGSYWTLMSEGAARLGLSSREAPASAASIQAELEAGRPIICVMAPGTFTEVGHFIVLERMAEDGGVVVHDSNSLERSMRTWSLDTICAEAEGIWSFAAA